MGDIETHKQSSKTWLKDHEPDVECWSAFFEPDKDLSGIRCGFRALFAVRNKGNTIAFSRLTDQARAFILQLP